VSDPDPGDPDPGEASPVRLAPVERDVATALLAGRLPEQIAFAPGYPSSFSLQAMDLFAGRRSASGFMPSFVVREDDGRVVGEIGHSLDVQYATATIGYSIAGSCEGRGYATAAARILIARLRADPAVRRIEARTLVANRASRRVLEKAGMRLVAERLEEVDGVLARIVAYELR
jgi:RimJ/RimL family protein N-acetyltransferase